MRTHKHSPACELPEKTKDYTENYTFVRKDFLPRGYAEGCMVSVYEIPPLKSAYPYHYHLKNEEVFYIISGEGMLKTPFGERTVKSGDLLYFPANPDGAHKLTNTSDTEKLVHIDFGVTHDLDVAVYPDSHKIGVWGKEINRVYPIDANVGYYEGE